LFGIGGFIVVGIGGFVVVGIGEQLLLVILGVVVGIVSMLFVTQVQFLVPFFD